MTDTPEIAALRELLDAAAAVTEMRTIGAPARTASAVDRRNAAIRAARTLLAAHDERESAPSVEVRIAVGVAPNGDYYAIGWNGGEDGSPELNVHDEMTSACPVHFITARVPLPVSTEIEGRVEQ